MSPGCDIAMITMASAAAIRQDVLVVEDGDAGEPVDDALRELYAVAPDAFLAARTDLAARLTSGGDRAAGQRIAKLRKPTVAAWIVNALALEDPTVVTQLADLGAQLQAAQDDLDAERLRELSGTRRTLVSGLCKRAFDVAGRPDPSATLNDEVRGTLDAAVADPDVAQRLGKLQRAESWSGFGFARTGQPQLTLVRGGRDRPTGGDAGASSSPGHANARPTAAQRRRSQRALDSAQQAFDQADAGVEQAQADLADGQQRIGSIEEQLISLRAELEAAKTAVTAARSAVTAAKQARQRARRELDRAERNLER